MKEQEIKEKVAEILTLLSQSNTRDAKIILKQVEDNIDRNSKVISASNIKLRFSAID